MQKAQVSKSRTIMALLLLFDNASTLYHTIPSFNNLEKNRLMKTLWDKEKMLVTSIFSFPHISYPSQNIFIFSVTFILLSANASNLDQSNILLFGNELNCQKIFYLHSNLEKFPMECIYQEIMVRGENTQNIIPSQRW